jgi:hypothetical protein
VFLRRLGALSLTSIETALIYVGIPALTIAVVTGLVFAGDLRRAKRYRPGRPFDFRPVWFLSAPEQVTDVGRPAVGSADRAALAAGTTEAASASTQMGGASDRW